MTTNHEFYGRPEREIPLKIIEDQKKKENCYGGVNEKSAEIQCRKMTSVLSGEKYKNSYEYFDYIIQLFL